MQIHELNNYNGNLDSGAYLAVDNGTDTGRISAARFLEGTQDAIDALETYLNNRIDNIIAGGAAPSEAEIIDARLGANGIVYLSLGSAIRGQFDIVKYLIDHNLYCNNLMDMTLDPYPVFLKKDTYLTVSTSDGSTVPSGQSVNLKLLDQDGALIDYYAVPTIGSNSRTIQIPQDTYYLQWFELYSVPLMVNAGINAEPYVPFYPSVILINEAIEEIKDDITVLENDIDRHDEEFQSIESVLGVVYSDLSGIVQTGKFIRGSDGAVTDITPATWSVKTFDIEENKKYKITAQAYYNNYYFAFYAADDSFISGLKATEAGTTILSNEIAIAPLNAKYLKITSNTDNQAAAAEDGFKVFENQWSNKKWVVFGDSLTEENIRTTKHYFDYIAEATGISIVNMGNGGSGYASEYGIGTAFPQRIGNVPTDADVITIFGSFNDLSEIGSSVTLGTASDSGTSTIGGLINLTLDNLFTAFPLANVGIVTPTPWIYANPTNEPNTASAYVQLIIDVCKRRGIPCLDLFHCSQLRPWDASYRALCYSKDEGNGVHPDETGHKVIAPQFEGFLQTLLI